jgi:cell division protein ZipA
MPELRWILVGFAIVLLAAIYLWGRRAQRSAAKRELSLHAGAAEIREPVIADEELATATVERDVALEEPVAVSRIEDGPYDRVEVADEVDVAAPAGTSDGRRVRVEPTLSDIPPIEEGPDEAPAATLSEHEPAPEPAPTVSSRDAPPPKRPIESCKILALRLAFTPHRLDGSRLLDAFAAESLQHGKYDIFHRLHDDGTAVFSVASMVEPGTFEPEKMPESQYPGITLFAQLPGPVPGMHALNELVACARRLQQSLGGTLQDDRGVPLTVHRVEKLRQEVREFERALS